MRQQVYINHPVADLSRAKAFYTVDELVARAVASGRSTHDPPEDFGFMYTHSFLDPDGHGWGVFATTAPSASP